MYRCFEVSPGTHSLFSMIDKKPHAARRKVIGQAVNERSMRLFESVMIEQIDIFIGLLDSSTHEAAGVNMTNLVENLAIDIVGLLAFGYQLRTQIDPANRFMASGMKAANYAGNIVLHFFLLYQIGLPYLANHSKNEVFASYRRLLDTMVKTRMAEDKHAKHDLFSITHQANNQLKDPSQGVRADVVWHEGLAFIPAGLYLPILKLSPAFQLTILLCLQEPSLHPLLSVPHSSI
jgi:cytochrome P450